MANHCSKCGESLQDQPNQCPACGQIQEGFIYKSRAAAAALALFGGNFGLHRFYLGQWWGIFYLLLFWTYIPWLVGVIEAIVFSFTKQTNWNDKYNQGIFAGGEKGFWIVLFAGIFMAIAMVGVLAAIALPAYQDYIIRSKMSEPLGVAAEIKEHVSEYTIREGRLPLSLNSMGMVFEDRYELVKSGSVRNGVIYVELDAASGTTGTLVLTPNYTGQTLEWMCGSPDIPQKYLPANCRN